MAGIQKLKIQFTAMRSWLKLELEFKQIKVLTMTEKEI